jgi:lariat debranching enzyme
MDDNPQRRYDRNRNVSGRGQKRVGHSWKGSQHGNRNNKERKDHQNNHKERNQQRYQDLPRKVPKISSSNFDPIEEWGEANSQSITFAIQGCCHGALDEVYERIKIHEEQTGRKIHVLLCCGDFQSLRNTADYHSIAVPPKYRSMGSFWKYYAGISHAPMLTIFIGGNHEASQPLSELYFGGWVAPNIYYLGAAGVVRVGGIRIGGISGIYKSHDYHKGRYEQPPYDRSSLRSVYHVRNVEVQRMKCLSSLDIMLSHDWPQGIEQYGNTSDLLRKKPFFRDEIERNDLGSRPNWEILNTVRPKWWFAAHLHVKFSATVRHDTTTLAAHNFKLVPLQVTLSPKNLKDISPKINKFSNHETEPANEIKSPPIMETLSSTDKHDMTMFRSLEIGQNCNGNDLTEQMTQFLSLDKCLPRRQYLSLLHVPFVSSSTSSLSSNQLILEYDAEWLALLKKTYSWNTPDERHDYESPKGWDSSVRILNTDLEWILNRLDGILEIPNNFVPTVPAFHPHEGLQPPLPRMGNPQTDHFLQVLDLPHVITIPYEIECPWKKDENEIDLSLEDKDAIDLDDDDDDDDERSKEDKDAIHHDHHDHDEREDSKLDTFHRKTSKMARLSHEG